jgi:hypothetical protein
MTLYSVLAGRIREALSDLQRVVHRAQELLNKAQQRNDGENPSRHQLFLRRAERPGSSSLPM